MFLCHDSCFCLYISEVKNIPILFFFVIAAELFGQTKTESNALKVIATSKLSGSKVSTFTLEQKSTQPIESEISVFVNPTAKFQPILGFGAAITDASAEVYAKMSPSIQKKLMTMFFHKDSGLAYNVIRTNMNSCDFSSESYTYIKEGDASLSTFDIAHDRKFKMPMIVDALKMSGTNTKVYISPWSPPAFMKSNNSVLHGGKLLPEFYPAWANYFVKFIQAYEKSGIPIWGLTIQNEPMATQIWESCIYTAEEERDLLKYHLGPTLAKNGLGNKKIIVWDHNRDLIYHRANTILSDKVAAKYVWGIGYHWYETWTGADPLHANLGLTQSTYPDKNILFTEGCKEQFNAQNIGDWAIGEKYAKNMINDFNNGVVGWTDWNVFLDEKGGPNHVGNYCFAPVHLNTQKPMSDSSIIITNAFHYMGHFSKYVQAGAKRIACSPSRSTLQTVAFENPNKQVVIVVLNTSESPIKYKLYLNNKMQEISIESHSIQTILK
jgi:glucosylceramidase